MGACNGYRYYSMKDATSEERQRIVCILFSKRGRTEAERTWEADADMLAEIAAKPEEMYGSY